MGPWNSGQLSGNVGIVLGDIPCQKGTLLPIPKIPGKCELWDQLTSNVGIILRAILCQKETSSTKPKIPGIWVLGEEVPQQWEQIPVQPL